MSNTHDCIVNINALLKDRNTQIATGFSLSDPKHELIQVATAKADSSVRGKPAVLWANFCPFCGVALKGDAS